MKPTIKPKNAASIWADGDFIYLDLPSPDGSISHTIKVGNCEAGICKVLTILKHRDSEARLASKGDPTQHQVDKRLFTLTPKTKIRHLGGQFSFTLDQHKAANVVLKRLGMIK